MGRRQNRGCVGLWVSRTDDGRDSETGYERRETHESGAAEGCIF